MKKKKLKAKEEECNWYDVDETGQFGFYDTDCGMKRQPHDGAEVEFVGTNSENIHIVEWCPKCRRRVNQHMPKGME